jgi:hypothetical protein
MKALLLAAALLAIGACKKEEASKRPAPISAAERKRGDDACNAYLKRLCACAEQKPALKDRCELKQAKPQALKMALSVDDDPSVSPVDVALAQESARAVIAKCIEENVQLDAEGCPP